MRSYLQRHVKGRDLKVIHVKYKPIQEVVLFMPLQHEEESSEHPRGNTHNGLQKLNRCVETRSQIYDHASL